LDLALCGLSHRAVQRTLRGFLRKRQMGESSIAPRHRAAIVGFVLAGVLVVAVLSRTTMAESALGGYAKGQIMRAVSRLIREGISQAEVSRQDTDVVVAMLHNAEAAARLRAAKHLAEESGNMHSVHVDFLDLLAQLSEEQEALLRAITESLNA
jgi:FlaG/FlaF family flagellin (archaellin)